MAQKRRYHPLHMLFDFFSLLKNVFFFAILLFVLNYGSDSTIVKYGRIIFYLIVIFSCFAILYRWLTQKYMLDDTSFHMYKGLFNKSERTIPYSKIHNIQRRQTFIHKLFGKNSAVFETSMADKDASVKFEVISKQELNELETWIHQTNSIEHEHSTEDRFTEQTEQNPSNRQVHFTPTKKDTFKASFSSLSVLLLVPIIFSIFSRLEDFFDVDGVLGPVFMAIQDSWWFIISIIVALIILSMAFGMVRTFLKYGKYEISSDEDTIYISKGVIDESTFTISKDKVQAVEITQSLIKRMLGLAEVRLTSAGSLSVSEDDQETNSLYPFLPVKRAHEIISEVLPAYEVTRMMNHLPKKSLWIRLLRPSWLWIIATIVLFIFKPALFGVNQAWWVISIGLFLMIYLNRILDYVNTRYVVNNEFVQIKKGGLQTKTFISKRQKVIEMNVSSSRLQKRLGLSTFNMVNRSKPVHHTTIQDIPASMADTFRTWYIHRTEEIEVESHTY